MEIKVEVNTRNCHKVVKFDPTKLKPFDKVLYLSNYAGRQEHWRIGFFEKYIPDEETNSGAFYYLMGDKIPMTLDKLHRTVIPFEGNEELVFENKIQ